MAVASTKQYRSLLLQRFHTPDMTLHRRRHVVFFCLGQRVVKHSLAVAQFVLRPHTGFPGGQFLGIRSIGGQGTVGTCTGLNEGEHGDRLCGIAGALSLYTKFQNAFTCSKFIFVFRAHFSDFPVASKNAFFFKSANAGREGGMQHASTEFLETACSCPCCTNVSWIVLQCSVVKVRVRRCVCEFCGRA